jgi:8-oxo-dGTP pyrophosphatase MutT (NUDIX family)
MILSQIKKIMIPGQEPTPADLLIDKVGMLPVVLEQGEFKVRLAKPLAKKPELGAPEFQLPKGTRQFFDATANIWRDIGRGHDPQSWENVQLEPLPQAALREAVEEVGMVPENIQQVWDLGVITVKSASSGGDKRVHMFVAEVKDKNNFTAPDAAHAAAENVDWFRPDDPAIRADHAKFLQEMQAILEPKIKMLNVGLGRR